MSRIVRCKDALAAADSCGHEIMKLLESAITERGSATLAISGGSSPKPMFQMFAKFAWEKVQLYFVDERCVPIDDPQSNFKFANDNWLGPGRFPKENVHRVHTELSPQDAAKAYAVELPQQFDVIHRGMGPDAHTASLFPGEALINDKDGLAAAVWVEKMKQWRVTLLPRILEDARNTVVLATGADKAQALKAVLDGPYDPMRYPCQIAREQAIWFVDEAAGHQG